MDIVAKINGEDNCNVELQVVPYGDLIERIVYYNDRLYARQIKSGEDYSSLHRSITILIIDFTLEKLYNMSCKENILIGEEEERKNLPFHTTWHLREDSQNIILTNNKEIHIISLKDSQLKENAEQVNEELLDWIEFLENPDSRKVNEKMVKNKALKVAKERLSYVSEDERLQRLVDLRQKAIWDERSMRRCAEEMGRREGMEDGMKAGFRKAKIEDAEKMLEEKIDINLIAKITGLTKEEIEKLKN